MRLILNQPLLFSVCGKMPLVNVMLMHVDVLTTHNYHAMVREGAYSLNHSH